MRLAGVALLGAAFAFGGCALAGGYDFSGYAAGDQGSGSGSCAPAVSGTCGAFPQCGCAEGQTCDVVSNDGVTSCVPSGSIPAFHACSGTAQCALGTTCVSGVCKPFCATDADCGAGLCQSVGYDAGGGNVKPIPGFSVCTAACDLAAPDAICGAGAGCYLLSNGTAADCAGGAGTATGTLGCSSGDPKACAPGYACLQSLDCARFCHVASPTECASGESCTSFGPPLVVQGTEYGVCR